MISYSGKRAIKDEREEQQLFESRARIGLIIIVLFMVALLGRYVWLQVYAFDGYAIRSEPT